MTAASLLEELQSQGITFTRSAAGGIVAKPKALLTDEIRQQLRAVRDQIEALIPPLERIEEHIPAYVQRPCVSPRGPLDHRCAAYCSEELSSASSSLFATKVRREARGCGDCDLAFAALLQRRTEAERREKLAKQIAKAKTNAKYFVPDEDTDETD